MIDKQEFTIRLGNELRKVREEKKISLKQFEVMENSIDRAMMSRIENGKETPNAYTIYRICSILGVKLSELYNRIEY